MSRAVVLEVHETQALCPVHFSVEFCDFRDEQIGDNLLYAYVSQIIQISEHTQTLQKPHIVDTN
jgi:hypothetical protein